MKRVKISVQRAIEILDPTHREHYDELPDGMEQVNEACRMGMEALKAQQCGNWQGIFADGYADGNLVYEVWACSECGEEFESDGEPPAFRFCPNCGARMGQTGREENGRAKHE